MIEMLYDIIVGFRPCQSLHTSLSSPYLTVSIALSHACAYKNDDDNRSVSQMNGIQNEIFSTIFIEDVEC